MEFSIVSNSPGLEGRELRKYWLDGISTIGVISGEPYGIRFHNTSEFKVGVRISVDGTDVLSGRKANLNPQGSQFVIEPYGVLPLNAWPETTNGGARFVFGLIENSVAVHTHGDIDARGYISAAVFVEPYDVRQSDPYGSRDAVLAPDMYDRGPSGAQDVSLQRDRPATGAGEYVSQHLREALGLTRPRFSQLIQVRYLFWNDLVGRLRKQGAPQAPIHPTGFEDQQLANLGTTPRLGDVGAPARYTRFVL
ncbi:MAG TPA: hypothetical protein VFT16_03815 [Candidatus Saccharimonadales bacterium]|nr:hypothetical protein [Candidatus Saccharimonadales bacterium]